MQQHAAERRFAASEFANDAHSLAAPDCEVDFAHRLDLGTAREPTGAAAETARHVLGPDEWGRRSHATSFHRKQREARPGPTSAKAGFVVWHGSAAQAQRGAKLQPGGRACGNGAVPGIAESCALTPS